MQEAGLLQGCPGPFLLILSWAEAQSEASPQAQAKLGAEQGTGQTSPAVC